jgi:diguanylate cyclase (GGDEF)-like protein/PAS domain S-box-containing protein
MEIGSDFYKSLLDGLYEGVYFVDRNRVIRYWNHAAEQITGFSTEDVIGNSCSDNILIHVDEHGRSLCQSDFCPAMKTMLDGHEIEAEVFLHHKEGHRLPILTKISPIRNSEGHIIGAVEVFTENVQMRAARERIEELRRLALIDPLTQIGNRRNAEIQLDINLGQMDRYGWPFGILFMDVDHFKKVNDRYGHETGDRVLQTIAKTLCSNLRSSDIPSRWGGEEFVIITPNVELSDLDKIGRKMLSLIRNSTVETPSGILQVTVSIGGTLAKPGDSPETLVSRSDQLMYQSKKGGRNRLSLN